MSGYCDGVWILHMENSSRWPGLICCRPVRTWHYRKTYFFKAWFPLVSVAVILLTEYPELLLIKPWSFQASENEKQVITKKCNLRALNSFIKELWQRQGLRLKFQAVQLSEDFRHHFSSHNSFSSLLPSVSRISMTRLLPARAPSLMTPT